MSIKISECNLTGRLATDNKQISINTTKFSLIESPMEDLAKLATFAFVFILFYSMIAKHIHNTYHVPDPLAMMTYGLLVGRSGLGLLQTPELFSKQMISHVSRIILCLQTMAVSLSLPTHYLRNNKQPLFFLVIVGGFLKCGIIFAVLKLLSTLSTPTCWAIAASLSPTDPILSSSIVKGRFARTNVPLHLRTLLSAESGINDGLGIILLNISVEMLHSYRKLFADRISSSSEVTSRYVPASISSLLNAEAMLLITGPPPLLPANSEFLNILQFLVPVSYENHSFSSAKTDRRISQSTFAIVKELLEPICRFLVSTIIKKVVLSIAVGYSIGYITRNVTMACCAVELVRSEILIVHSFVLTFLGLAIMDLIGGSELICIFFIGTALNAGSWYSLEGSSQKMSEIVEGLFSNTFFILIGSIVDLPNTPLHVFAVSAIIIAVSRPLSVLAIGGLMPQLQDLRERLFVGWFGPIGVGALYYCVIYDSKMQTLTTDFAMCIVFMSTLVHGLSVPLFCLGKAALQGIQPGR